MSSRRGTAIFPDISTLPNLDFEVIREGWSIYDLEDGNRLRAKATLTRLRGPKIPEEKGDRIAPEISTMILVDAPIERRGPKGQPATKEESEEPEKHGGVEVAIRSTKEPWNEYQIVGTELKLRAKIVVSKVWGIKDRYDGIGDPVYALSFSILPIVER